MAEKRRGELRRKMGQNIEPVMDRRLAVAVVLIVLAVAFPAAFREIGFAPALIVGAAGTLGLVAWLKTTYRQPAGAEVLPYYLLTLAFLQFHITEEFKAGFAPRMSSAFGIHFTQTAFLLIFATVGPGIWILAALGLLKRHPLANYIVWFIFIGPGFMEWTHYVFPIIEGGRYHYFPGMWTAWLPMIPGISGMRFLYRQTSATHSQST